MAKYNIAEIVDFETWSSADSDIFERIATSLINRFKECKAADCDTVLELISLFYTSGTPNVAWYVFKTDEDLAIAKTYDKFAAGTEDIGEVKKDTPYLILTIGDNTKWFDESGVKKLQEALNLPTI